MSFCHFCWQSHSDSDSFSDNRSDCIDLYWSACCLSHCQITELSSVLKLDSWRNSSAPVSCFCPIIPHGLLLHITAAPGRYGYISPSPRQQTTHTHTHTHRRRRAHRKRKTRRQRWETLLRCCTNLCCNNKKHTRKKIQCRYYFNRLWWESVFGVMVV